MEMQSRTSPRHLLNVTGRAVALALGVAVIVLGILGTLTPAGAVPLLGIGLFSLALGSLQE